MDRTLKSINNIVSLFVLIFLCLTSFNSILAEEESGISVQIDISETTNEYIVSVLDDPYYEQEEPTVFVNNTKNFTKPYVYDSTNDRGIVPTLFDGEISFTVDKGGEYHIYDITGHTLVEVPNCKFIYCTDCKKFYSPYGVLNNIESNQIIVNSQKLVKVEAKDSTCLTNGNYEYWYCKNTKKCYSSDNVLTLTDSEYKSFLKDKMSHDYVNDVCSNCQGKKLSKTIENDTAAKELIKKVDSNKIQTSNAQNGFKIDSIKSVKNKVETATSVDNEVKDNLINAINNKNIDSAKSPLEFFELSVELVDENNKTANLTEIPGSGILFEVEMSGELAVEDGYIYRVFRMHNSTTDEISGVVINENSISFRSNLLSTFAIVKVADETTSNSNSITYCSSYIAPKTCIE